MENARNFQPKALRLTTLVRFPFYNPTRNQQEVLIVILDALLMAPALHPPKGGLFLTTIKNVVDSTHFVTATFFAPPKSP